MSVCVGHLAEKKKKIAKCPLLITYIFSLSENAPFWGGHDLALGMIDSSIRPIMDSILVVYVSGIGWC
jgi:hypothetical protein